MKTPTLAGTIQSAFLNLKHTLCLVITFAAATGAFGAENAKPVPPPAPPSALSAQPAAQPDPAHPFLDGDVVTLIGDSITHGGFYHDYLYLFYATRFPDRKITFFNCGISGDTASGAFRRINGDILRHKPTVATLMLGMNDVTRSLYDEGYTSPDLQQRRDTALGAHSANMRKLAEELAKNGSRLIFMTPSIYDQTAKIEKPNSPGVNDALHTCGENARYLAREFNGLLIDFNGPMTAINRDLQAKDPTATIIGADRIHPGEKGHLIMAHLFLKAQNVPPFVADIAVDALGKNQVSFTKKEPALPFPVSKASAPALELVPFMEELNMERLTVAHLPEGQYDLLIDDAKISSFHSGELAKGVNLAAFPSTPQYQQALQVAALDGKRHEIVKRLRTIDYVEWKMGREIGDPTEFDWSSAVTKMNADPKITGWPRDRVAEYSKLKPQQPALTQELHDLAEAIHSSSQPKEHRFLVRLTSN